MANRMAEVQNAYSSGASRTHSWRLKLLFPEWVTAGTEVSRQASFLATSAKTPSANIGVIDISYAGRTLKMPGDKQFENLTFNFNAVNDMNVLNSLERWSEGINGSISNTGFTDVRDYARDIELTMLGANDQEVKVYVLQNAWPVTLSGIDLNSADMNAVAMYTVEFAYLNYASDTTR